LNHGDLAQIPLRAAIGDLGGFHIEDVGIGLEHHRCALLDQLYLHTVSSLVGLFNNLSKELLPSGTEVFHIADEIAVIGRIINICRYLLGKQPF
jgi:hypothetical protein